MTRKQRIDHFWRDVERFEWSLPFALILHFGKFPELLAPELLHRRYGGGYDACLPDPGTWEYEVFDTFVKAAEKVSQWLVDRAREKGPFENTAMALRGFRASRHADGTLKANWERPFDWRGDVELEFVDGVRETLAEWEKSLELEGYLDEGGFRAPSGTR